MKSTACTVEGLIWIRWSCLLAIALGAPLAASGADAELTLREAVRQTLASNLDLVAQEEQLAADREQVGLARSVLLPQAVGGAQGQIIDDDRADGKRGNVSQKSATVFAGVTQVLYDDESWAGYSIQKHVYEAQRYQFDEYRLGVISNAAGAFLNLERAEATVAIQEMNRELTRQNIETARQRVATGYSGERDVLRWQSQLASNDTAVVQARTGQLTSRFELNRLRDRAREEPVHTAESTLDVYGFIFARPEIAELLADEQAERRLRDFMVRVGLERSPVLEALRAATKAEERQLTASKRAFWAPTVDLGVGVNYLAAKESGGGAPTNTMSSSSG